MYAVDASKKDKTGIRSTNERIGRFYSEDDQLNQEERRGTPSDVAKANSYWEKDGVAAIFTQTVCVRHQG